MAKIIYLLRHAEAVSKYLNQDDKDRELTTSGIEECQIIGTELAKDFNCDAVFTSTAVRTIETTSLVMDILKYPKEKIHAIDELYEASPRVFNDVIIKAESTLRSIMIVGHNPTISYITEYFTKSEIGDMMTAGVAIIRFNIDQWSEVSQGNGELVRYIYPSMLKS